jgi:hypothetical protein
MIEMILRFFAIPAGLDCARYGPEGGWGWDPPEGPLVGHQDDVKPHQPQTRYDSHQVDESVPIKTAEDAGLLTSELPEDLFVEQLQHSDLLTGLPLCVTTTKR